MCGLVGFSAPKEKKFNVDKIKLLLWNNQERGKDSFGYFTPESNIIKDIGKVEDIMSKKDFNIVPSHTFIGHVRHATIGEKTKENAHPFNYGNIVLAMNGTLDNAWELARQNRMSVHDFEVDSQVVAALLNKYQTKQPLSMLLGACALVYTDTFTGKMYCYRNSDRPLYRGKIDDCMYISSISTSLKIIGCTDVKEFKADTLYEIEGGQIKQNYKVKRAVAKTTVIDSKYLTTPLHFDAMHKSEFVGLFLQPKRNIDLYGGFKVDFRMGYYYEVAESITNNPYDILVIDHVGNLSTISKFCFNEEQPVIQIKDYVFGLVDLIYNDKSKLGDKGDLYLVEKIRDNKYFCRNVITGKSSYIDPEYLRYASKNEADDFMDMWNLFPFDSNPFEEGASNQPVVVSEEEVYKKEVECVEHESFEKLVEWTMDQLLDNITDLEEVTKKPNSLKKIVQMKILIENYNAKEVALKKIIQNA